MEAAKYICCSEKMIVGRWYKLLSWLEKAEEVMDKDTTKWECTGINCVLVHDLIYFNETGTATIKAEDSYGYIATKSIEVIEEPAINRSKISVSSSEELINVCVNNVTNAYVELTTDVEIELIPKPEDTYLQYYEVPEGTIIDLGGHKLSYTVQESVKGSSPSSLFMLCNDNSGIINGIFEYSGEDFEVTNVTHEQTNVINVYQGYNIQVKDIVFNNVLGFNMVVGTTWYYPWSQTENYRDCRWQDTNVSNGYINDNGEFVNDADCWCSTEFIKCPNTYKNEFILGRMNPYSPTTVKVCRVAFYDENYNFIAQLKGVQYYRVYNKPQNAKYWKITIVQSSAPSNNDSDTSSIVIMYGIMDIKDNGFYHDRNIHCLVDAYFDNIRCFENESGVMSIVGHTNDCHYNRVFVSSNGTINKWGMDFEDGWLAMVADVLSYCVIGNSGTVQTMFNAGIGTSAIACYFDKIVCNNTAWKHLFVGCLILQYIVYNARGYNIRINCTVISYENITVDTETYFVKKIGEYPTVVASDVRKMVLRVSKKEWNYQAGILQS